MTLFDLIGLVGVAAYLSAYGLLQMERLASSDNRYLLLNGVGSLLILVSLFASFNLPSFVTQVVWLILTIVGFFRARSRGRDATGDGSAR